MKKTSAVALMSGGLDSNIAVRLIYDMGIEIIGVHFTGPFCMCNRGSGGCIHYAGKLAEELGIEFSTQGLGKEYMDIVLHPKHGRGSGMNPCLDCRIMMFRKAKAMMQEKGASFILTGEVLGQRPMSQLSDKLRIIERESDLEGLILRPLSAKHMKPTIPEEKGLVDRNALLDVQGRSRKTQMDLAEKLAIGDYPCPAGGCLLTDKPFSAKLREHIDHNNDLQLSDISKLKAGRHFRLPAGAKLIVGRNKEENERMEKIAGETAIIMNPKDVMGPAGILYEDNNNSDRELAANILAAYCDKTPTVTVELQCESETANISVKQQNRSVFSEMKI